MASIKERAIEARLKQRVEDTGGLCIKLAMTYNAGMPDRLCLFPNAFAAFVELKAPGKKPRPIQLYVHDKLRARGFKVYVIDNYDDIELIIKEAGYAK